MARVTTHVNQSQSVFVKVSCERVLDLLLVRLWNANRSLNWGPFEVVTRDIDDSVDRLFVSVHDGIRQNRLMQRVRTSFGQ
jgi:hypothetical protein